MTNRVSLIGRLTRDPVKVYGQWHCTSNFHIPQGENITDFVTIVAWRQLAEICANYLRKGRLTAVEGRLETQTYENDDGKRIFVTEVMAEDVRFLEPKREEDS